MMEWLSVDGYICESVIIITKFYSMLFFILFPLEFFSGIQDIKYSSCLPTPLSMSGYLKNLPKDLCAALGNCYFPPNTSELVAEFHIQSLFVASNGSVCNNGATQAWILCGTQTKIRVYGHGPIPVGMQPLTSLQAEVGGFVGGMLALGAVLSTACEPISAQCCVGTLIDNMALIYHIQSWHHQGSGGTLAPVYV